MEQETIKVLSEQYGSATVGDIYDGTKDRLILGELWYTALRGDVTLMKCPEKEEPIFQYYGMK